MGVGVGEISARGERRPRVLSYMGSFGARLRMHWRLPLVDEDGWYSIDSILRSQITAEDVKERKVPGKQT